MSEESVETIRNAYAQLAQGDFSSFDDLSDRFEMVTAPEMPDAGTYRGAEARRWMREWVGSFDHLTVEAVEVIDPGEQVVVEALQRGRSRGSTADIELRHWAVFTFSAGSPIRLEMFRTRGEAFQVAGLRE